MGSSWEEVAAVKDAGRHELVLHGPKMSERIDKNGVDPKIYTLTTLNYLEISSTSLSELKPKVGSLVNLTTLVLCNNRITEVPTDIGRLSKLKILNLSNNKIETIPDVFAGLPKLDTLNLSMNKLTALPSVKDLLSLHIFNLAHNQLENIPDGLFSEKLVHLSQIIVNDNVISELSQDIENLPHLNVFDISNNRLTSVPPELCRCPKLKEINLKGNKMSDKRFLKLTEKGAPVKSIFSYLETELKKSGKGAKGGKGGEKKQKKKKGKKDEEEEEVAELAKNLFNVLRMPSESNAVVTVTPAVISVRPYIVCCIVRNLDLQATNSTFKNFISLQVYRNRFHLVLNYKFDHEI